MRTASQHLITAAAFVIASLSFAANANTPPPANSAKVTAEPGAMAASAADMVVANPAGKTTVTAVVDYQDYTSHMIRDRLAAFAKENPDIKIAVKPWAAGGPLSRFCAKAAYAVAKQGRLPEFHAAMMSDLGPHTWYSLRNVAPQLGLDWKKFESDFADESLDRQVDADAQSIAKLKISNSPAFIAGGEVFSGAWDKINFSRIAEAARSATNSGAVASR